MYSSNKLFDRDPKTKYFKCLKCGDCCKTSDIPITVFDILRLTKHLTKKTGDVIIEFCRLGYHPCQKNGIVTDDMLGVIFMFKDRPCKYLLDELIPACTIYNTRPIVCENTPNPYNPWSINHMYPTCPGLQTSCIFPEGQRDYYRQICNLHGSMLSLTARFFLDSLGLGQPLSELSARFGNTPDMIVTPTGQRNTYELIEILDKTMFNSLQKHFDVMQETVKMFKENRRFLLDNLKDILLKTLTSDSLKNKFLTQVGL